MTIQSVDTTHCYKEYGSFVIKATLTTGKIEVMDGGYINEIDTTSATSDSSVIVDGYVSKVTAASTNSVVATGSGYVANNNGAALNTPSSATTTISTLAQLHEFRDRVNAGQDYSGLTVNLSSDIDLTGAVWAPIGTVAHPFAGTFNGNGHKIIGLTNAGYTIDATQQFTTSSAKNRGGAYGLFGIVGKDDKDVTISNIVFENVDISIADAAAVGAAVGGDRAIVSITTGEFDALSTDEKKNFVPDSNPASKYYYKYTGDIEISNITVSGTITSTNVTGCTVGGVVGKLYSKGEQSISYCTNNADVSSATGTSKVAGILGYTSGSSSVTADHNTNNGHILTTTHAAGILNNTYAAVVNTITNNTNTGVIETNNTVKPADRVAYIAMCASATYESNKAVSTFTGNTNSGTAKNTSSTFTTHNFILINASSTANDTSYTDDGIKFYKVVVDGDDALTCDLSSNS